MAHSVAASPDRGRQGNATRERILDAAAEVLNANGYAGTRLSDIALVAELQAPAIYYYFKSRESVIEAVIQAGQRSVIEHVTAALEVMPESTSSVDRIMGAVDAHLRFMLTQSQYASASIRNIGQLPPEMRERQLSLRREYGVVWRRLFEDALDAGELPASINVNAARMLVIGALNWVPEWWDGDRGDIDEFVRAAQRFVRGALEVG